MRVLGIDPGSRICGWGIVEEVKTARAVAHVDNGIIAPNPKWPLPRRLDVLFTEMDRVIQAYKPDAAAVESLFFAKNAKSALVLGHARGVVILAAQRQGLTIDEYSPSQVKQAVCGYGKAEKPQVAKMVMAILGLPEVAQADASDALACAICHCNSYRFAQAMKNH